jgi:hypothetical protein
MIQSPNAKGYKTAMVELGVVAASGLVVENSYWCVWKAKWSEGRDKPAKIPCNAGCKPLSVTDPKAWLSFADASKAYGTGKFDGVGVLMQSYTRGGEETVGLDLDRCMLADGSVVPEAADVVADFLALGGYIELSPSGLGLRQFLRGMRLAEYREKCKVHGLFDLEVYDPDSDRYLTVTGGGYPGGGGSGIVAPNEIMLNAFIRKWCEKDPEAPAMEFDPATFSGVKRTATEVMSLLKKYDKSGKMARLLAGDLADYSDDHSAADLALLTGAAYYSRDPEILDGVLRVSGLMREKWQDRVDYRSRSIRKALKLQTKNHDASIAATKLDRDRQKDQAKVADGFLIGGSADLRTKAGWKKDVWALSELLIRDRRLTGVAFWDSFSNLITITRPLNEVLDDKAAPPETGRLIDDHFLAFQTWFGRHYGLNLKRDQVAEAITRWAQAIRRNPALDRLNGFAWDGKSRLDDWLVTYCGASTVDEDSRDIGPYVRAVGAKSLISVVARAMVPGCKVDTMLILESKQGGRKSSAIEALALAIGDDYFREGFKIGDGSKDTLLALRGRLMVEWSEMAGMSKRDRNELKNFLTLRKDSYRAVYGMAERDWPRTACFFGSTNDSHYLSDPTGNRRFWPVKVKRTDLDSLRADVIQLWAEAVARYRQGEIWWFDEADPRDLKIVAMAEREQASRLGIGLWDELGANLAERLAHDQLFTADGQLAEITGGFRVLQMTEWLTEMVGGQVRIDEAVWLRVSEGLRRSGWENFKSNGAKWRLTIERRDELRQLFDIDPGPHKSLRQIRAEKVAEDAIRTAKGDQSVKGAVAEVRL